MTRWKGKTNDSHTRKRKLLFRISIEGPDIYLASAHLTSNVGFCCAMLSEKEML